MLKPALALLATLGAACITDVSDDTAEAPEAIKPKYMPGKPGEQPPNIPDGPCKTACEGVPLGRCGRWQDECASDWPDDLNVTCGDQSLTCRAAKWAMNNDAFSEVYCYRLCTNLN